MRLIVNALLFQALSAPDPAQMEKAPDLGYVAVPHGLAVPDHITPGAFASVALTRDGHLLVFNRGRFPLLEFETIDADQIGDIMSGKPPRPPKPSASQTQAKPPVSDAGAEGATAPAAGA